MIQPREHVPLSAFNNRKESICLAMRKPLPYRIVKRSFDLAFSAGVVSLSLVPGVLLGVLVAKDTGGFPIYMQVRVGQYGRPFRIFKFRTMTADSDGMLEMLSAEELEELRREHKLASDPRITKLGGFLRSTSIDEMPQFVNVLLGQMSVVGPRPITFEELEEFGDSKALFLSCRPGITGLWQTGPRNDATFKSGERQRIELDYVIAASTALDAQLILKTIQAIVKRTGR